METREASPNHCLIKIESFYNSGNDKYETKEFWAGRHRWRLIIYPNGDNTVGEDRNCVSVYLVMADTSSYPANWEVNAVFSIFLFDQISANYLCSLGMNNKTFPRNEVRMGNISKKIMSEPLNGYLVDDTCVFGAEVFIVKKEASIPYMSLKNFDVPYKRDWKIQNFSKLGNFWSSEEFNAGGHKWKIRLYSKGDGKEAESHVTIYLYYLGSESVQANYTICIKNQVSDQHMKRTSIDHLFSASDNSWGWGKFMEIATMNNPKKGFVVNDSCLVHIEISSVQVVPNAMSLGKKI
ncbi:PREDICTED: uncharacterized protein LOC105953897 [Erythranthe guttata]|uniref:uncharacterized protein LOC105953897 n=1 Tax=Erythranthe guttata TaxID=4155 RepID=UPI00064D9DAF|nr:PREDICTED: uncharacterized protein LOC105953897 [Erythranthe guttata]|eukprot:XP_012833033.1 PREDICTED: uncharacterized protein LOC105953897 [Erythranthe guttata]